MAKRIPEQEPVNEALLEELSDAPDDRALLERYAEWLEREGEPRAKLIQAGISLLDAPHSRVAGETHSRLLRRYKTRWFGKTLRPKMAAGFAREATVFGGEDEPLSSLLSRPAMRLVRRLTILLRNPGDLAGTSLPRTLESIAIADAGRWDPHRPSKPEAIGPETLRDVAAAAPATLTEFILQFVAEQPEPGAMVAGFAPLLERSGLRTLSLVRADFVTDLLRRLPGTPLLAGLARLDLFDCDVGDAASATVVGRAEAFAQLEEFRVTRGRMSRPAREQLAAVSDRFTIAPENRAGASAHSSRPRLAPEGFARMPVVAQPDHYSGPGVLPTRLSLRGGEIAALGYACGGCEGADTRCIWFRVGEGGAAEWELLCRTCGEFTQVMASHHSH